MHSSIIGLSRNELLALNPETVPHAPTFEEARYIFETLEALWIHNGNPHQPHVELTSGKHSNGYINCKLVLEHDGLRRLLARQLVHQISFDYPDFYLRAEDWVVGSDTSATKLACDVAFLLGARHGIMRKTDDKQQVWCGECTGKGRHTERTIAVGERVLHIEELMTTAFTAERLREGIRAAHPGQAIQFIRFLPVLMYRSDVTSVDDSLVVPVNRYHIENWDPPCPKCKEGSPVLRDPKQHWAELTV